MYPSADKDLNRETNDAVYFFTTAFHPLDNFSAHAIEIWGKMFPTVEHAFQWKKFTTQSTEIAKKILRAKSPEAVKKISDTYKEEIPQKWHDEKVYVMKELLMAKAQQHEDVQDALKRTGNKTIIENSPVDRFWGIGAEERGQNIIGKIWMEIREELNK